MNLINLILNITPRRSNKSHILNKKTTKRKRRLRQPNLVSKADEKKMHKILPYGS